VVFQSQRLARYDAALDRLRAMGLLYPCFCTRADIAASLSAPHGPEGAVYPGTCRGLPAPDLTQPHCWRLDVERALKILPGTGRGTSEAGGGGPPRAMPDEAIPLHRSASDEQVGLPPAIPAPSGGRGDLLIPPRAGEDLTWHDAFVGTQSLTLHTDPVLARKDAPASYHLAVTVDDAAQHVTHIIRGRDLFEATHIHRLLQALLDLPTPEYCHHALLTGTDGTRLAKRHGAPTLEAMRLAGQDGRALASQLRAGQLPVGIARAKD